MPKFILLNGPAGSGKDTIGGALMEYLFKEREMQCRNIHVGCSYAGPSRYVRLAKFAAPLKSAVADFMQLSSAEYQHYFESSAKNSPQDRFYGVTPRQALINFSENYAKPTFGKEIFAKLCWEYAIRESLELVIVTDCGFQVEADVIVNNAGVENVAVFQLIRAGCTFEGDSREFVRVEGRTVRVNNNRDVYATRDHILDLARERLGI